VYPAIRIHSGSDPYIEIIAIADGPSSQLDEIAKKGMMNNF